MLDERELAISPIQPESVQHNARVRPYPALFLPKSTLF